MEVNVLSEEERQPFVEAGETVEETFLEMTGETGEEILNQLKADLEAVQ